MSTDQDLFPYPSIRPGQRRFLEDAATAGREGRILLAHAPTGMGKTAVGLAAGLRRAREEGLQVFFLTSKQSQHRVAIDTIHAMRNRGVRVTAVDVIAKQSMCLQADRPRRAAAFMGYCDALVRSRSCAFYRRESRAVARVVGDQALHVQEGVTLAREYGVCPHKVALEAAAEADVLVCDFNYLFSDLRETVLGRVRRDLPQVFAIVDEAHNLPDRVRSQVAGEMTPGLLERAKREAMGADAGVAQGLSRLASSLRKTIAGRTEEEVSPEFLGDLVSEACRGDTLLELEMRLEGTYRLLDASVLTTPVFSSLGGGILMSGTLHPVGMYGDILGIPPTRRLARRYPSPFDPARRLLLATADHTSSYSQRRSWTYRALASTIRTTCEAMHGNAAAFFPSYDFAARVSSLLREEGDRPLLVENPRWTKEDRDAALQWLERHRDPGGLLCGVMGGGLAEGVDYRGNVLRLVFIVGLPVSPPTVEAKALQRELARKHGSGKAYEYTFLFPAVSKILQAAGRPIRSESDRAAIVFLESRLLEGRYRKLFPRDFDYRRTDTLKEDVSGFLEAADTVEPEGRPTPGAEA